MLAAIAERLELNVQRHDDLKETKLAVSCDTVLDKIAAERHYGCGEIQNVEDVMKVVGRLSFSLVVIGCLAAGPAHAQQSRMKACGAEWQSMKAAGQTAGKTWKDFRKECLARAGGAAGAPAAGAPTAAGTPAAGQATGTPVGPAAGKAAAGKGSAGRQALVARERACGAEWKAAKAAGTVPAGTKWPQYWSQCNARKKAEGM